MEGFYNPSAGGEASQFPKWVIRVTSSAKSARPLHPHGRTYLAVIGSSESVESRMGAVAWAMRQRSVSHPRSSNRTCGFPASGSPTGFVVRHTENIADRKRHRAA